MAWTSIWLDSLIKKILNYRKSLTNVSNRIKYEHLAPITDIKYKDAQTFNESLEYALNNPQVHNIAVTGSYGSGKSSLIGSFIEKQDKHEKRFLQISLASFTLEKENQSINDIYTEEAESLEENESDNAETEIGESKKNITETEVNKKKESVSSTYIPFSKLAR